MQRVLRLFVAACFCFSALLTSACTNIEAQTTIQVTLEDGAISPASIEAQRGTKFTVRVTNRGSKRHNLVIPAFFIFTQNLNPGESVTASFTPDKSGSFPYYSDTGGKPEPGMRGTLTVQ